MRLKKKRDPYGVTYVIESKLSRFSWWRTVRLASFETRKEARQVMKMLLVGKEPGEFRVAKYARAK